MVSKQKQKNNDFDILDFCARHDRVLVRAVRPQPKDGKLIDPKQYEDKPEFGEVVKLGEEVVDLKVGQIVRFGKYSSEKIRSKGQDYFIVHEEDVSFYLPTK